MHEVAPSAEGQPGQSGQSQLCRQVPGTPDSAFSHSLWRLHVFSLLFSRLLTSALL